MMTVECVDGDGTGFKTTYIDIGYGSSANIAGFQFNMENVEVIRCHQVVQLVMQDLTVSCRYYYSTWFLI